MNFLTSSTTLERSRCTIITRLRAACSCDIHHHEILLCGQCVLVHLELALIVPYIDFIFKKKRILQMSWQMGDDVITRLVHSHNQQRNSLNEICTGVRASTGYRLQNFTKRFPLTFWTNWAAIRRSRPCFWSSCRSGSGEI